jgi:hypothetical protein
MAMPNILKRLFAYVLMAVAIMIGLIGLVGLSVSTDTFGHVLGVCFIAVALVCGAKGIMLRRSVPRNRPTVKSEVLINSPPDKPVNEDGVMRSSQSSPPRLSQPAVIKNLVVEGFWCESVVRLPVKVETPLGGKVSSVRVCVDVTYAMEGRNVVLQEVRLSRAGGQLGDASINVASERTGEGWFASDICPESYLIEAVQKELSLKDSQLKRVMLGKWYGANREAYAGSLVDALNAHATPDEIADVLSRTGYGVDLVFTYTKPTGDAEVRQVTVMGVFKDSIRAQDSKDGVVKSFRIDRISKVQTP